MVAKEKDQIEKAFKSLYGEGKNHNIASSYLIEPNKPKDFYSPDKIDDSQTNTAWVVNKNQGVGEFIYFGTTGTGEVLEYKEIKDKTLNYTFTIVNGYAENEKLFKANNRVKKVSVEIYELTAGATRFDSFIIKDSAILNSTHEFEIKDVISNQKFDFSIMTKLKPKDLGQYNFIYLMAKLTIREIYPGDKHKDTCISEASVTLRK